MQSLYLKSVIVLLCTPLLLFGCSTPPNKQTSDASQTIPASAQSTFEALLSKARNATTKQEQALLFYQAGKASLEASLYTQAQFAFDSVEAEVLPQNIFQDYVLDQIAIGIHIGDEERLNRYEPLLNLDQALRTSLSEQERIVRIMASAYSVLNKTLEAAVLLSDYEGVFGLQESTRLTEEIWLMLQRSSTEELTRYQYTGQYPNTIAWLELARQIKLSQASIDQQYLELQQWMSAHPDHPATKALPLELDLLSRLPETAPKEIVLALPLSGTYAKAGNAVRDGFMANYYLQSSTEKRVAIRTFDTASQPIETLYQTIDSSKALDNNTLVIGPLIKGTLEKLALSGSIEIPTLALNDLDKTFSAPNLYLFGLNPEDELSQIAEKMVARKLLRIGVITPKTGRGERLAEEFTKMVEHLGGHIVSTKLYESQSALAATVSDLLSTTASQQRARKVRSATGLRIESEPRRRQDLDAIFMIADNPTAKQIKPMLAFNFASDLPVFANSQIHDPLNPDANNDLNGVQFVDIPWMFARTTPLRSQIDELLPSDSQQYARFFALGADAFTLAPRLHLLIDIENTHVQGQTGLLSVTPQGRVQRQLQWARYQRGKAQTIN